MKTIITFALILIAGSGAQARLGESPRDMQKRFGPQLRKTSFRLGKQSIERRIYFQPGWIVVVTYWQGSSAREQYYRIARPLGRDWVSGWFGVGESFLEKERPTTFLQNVSRHCEGLSNIEVRDILQANGEGWRWTQARGRELTFVRTDRSAIGQYLQRNPHGESMVVSTTKFEGELQAARERGDGEDYLETGRVGSF